MTLVTELLKSCQQLYTLFSEHVIQTSHDHGSSSLTNQAMHVALRYLKVDVSSFLGRCKILVLKNHYSAKNMGAYAPHDPPGSGTDISQTRENHFYIIFLRLLGAVPCTELPPLPM